MEIWKWTSGVIIEDDNDTSAFQEHSVIRFLWILLPDFSSHISLNIFLSARCNGKKSLDRSEEKLNEKKLDTVPEESNGDT